MYWSPAILTEGVNSYQSIDWLTNDCTSVKNSSKKKHDKQEDLISYKSALEALISVHWMCMMVEWISGLNYLPYWPNQQKCFHRSTKLNHTEFLPERSWDILKWSSVLIFINTYTRIYTNWDHLSRLIFHDYVSAFAGIIFI